MSEPIPARTATRPRPPPRLDPESRATSDDADRLLLADPAAQDGDETGLWARLRRHSAVHRNERPDGETFWAVLTYPETVRVLKDVESFRSSRGMRLDADPAAVAAASAGRMLIVTDPPDHARMKHVLGSAFTPRMIARLRRTMTVAAVDLVDRAVEARECDISRLAARLPASVICDMLGVPAQDRDFMVDRTMIAWSSTSADEVEQAERARAHTEIMVYFAELADRRRRDPQDDIVTALVNARIDGVTLSDDEVVLNCDGIVSGGNETSRHAAVGGLLAFAEHPDQWERVRADHSLVPSTVHEILRYTSPVMHVVRTATRRCEIGGQSISPGDRLAAWLPSANRDEQVFTWPEQFDVGRRPNRHLAFSHGAHHCLGSALAVAELEVLLGVLLTRVRSVELAGRPVRLRSNLVRGYESLPVRLRPATPGLA